MPDPLTNAAEQLPAECYSVSFELALAACALLAMCDDHGPSAIHARSGENSSAASIPLTWLTTEGSGR